jgi:hypothetical protein
MQRFLNLGSLVFRKKILIKITMKRQYTLALLFAVLTIGLNAQINYKADIKGSNATFILTKQGKFYEGVTWDFGDGTVSQGSNTMEDTVTHNYSKVGDYTVCVIGMPMPMATNDTMCKTFSVSPTTITTAACGSYLLNGKTYDISGTYIQTLKNNSGNDSIITLNLTIYPLPTTTYSNTQIACVGQTLGIAFTGSTGYSYKWSSSDGEILSAGTSQTIIRNQPANVTYTCSVTDNSTGCSTTQKFNFNFVGLPAVSIVTPKQALCGSGDFTTLTAQGALQYQWNTAVSTTSISVTPTSTTTYTVTGIDAYGCKNTASSVVTVASQLNIVAKATPSQICMGYSSTLSATGANNYTWNNGLGSYPTPTVYPTGTATYKVTGFDVNGCFGTASVVVTVNPIPSISIKAKPERIIVGDSTELSLTGGVVACIWSNNVTTPTQIVRPTVTTTYSVTVTAVNNGCGTGGNNSTPLVLSITVPVDTCSPTKNTIVTSACESFTLNGKIYVASGIYTQLLKNVKGCDSTLTLDLTINPLPKYKISGGGTFCESEPIPPIIISILDGKSPYTLQYIDGAGMNHTVKTSGSYAVPQTYDGTCSVTNITDDLGCIAKADNSQSSTIIIFPKPDITVNASSPICLAIGESKDISSLFNYNPKGGSATYSSSSAIISGSTVIGSATSQTTYLITSTYTVRGCKSVATNTITVNPLPTVIWAASNPTLVCNDGSPITLSANVSPVGGIGTFSSLSGLTKSSETTAVLDLGMDFPGVKTINYSYTDLNGCVKNAPSTSITIFDTPEPLSPQSISTLSSPIPATGAFGFDVSDQYLTSVRWYNNPRTNVIAVGNRFEPSIARVGSSPDSLVAGCKNYLLTQTIYGCESKPVEAMACVYNCPSKAPIAGVDQNICNSSQISPTVCATAQGQGSLDWFSVANTTGLKLQRANCYTETKSNVGVYNYYVAEWNAAMACYGPTTRVTLTINPKPKAVFDASVKSDYCSSDGSISLKAKDALLLSGTGLFTVDGFVKTSSTIVIGTISTDKIYNVKYIRTTDKYCKDSVVKSITVHAPMISSVTEQIIVGDSIQIGSTYYKTAETVTMVYTNIFGCDSTVNSTIVMKIIGDTNGDGLITNDEIAGDENGDHKISGTEICGDVNGNGIIDNSEIVGDVNGDSKIGTTEVLGDTNANGILDVTETTGSAIKKSTFIQIYPTIVPKNITIDLGKTVSGTIELTNILGATIREIAFNSQNQIAVNVQSLPAGLYIVKVNAGGIVYSQKIIKE